MLFCERQVCELDIIFNFEKAYFILDEFLLGGEAQETSKKNVLKAIEQADLLQEVRPPHDLRHMYANISNVSANHVRQHSRKLITAVSVVQSFLQGTPAVRPFRLSFWFWTPAGNETRNLTVNHDECFIWHVWFRIKAVTYSHVVFNKLERSNLKQHLTHEGTLDCVYILVFAGSFHFCLQRILKYFFFSFFYQNNVRCGFCHCGLAVNTNKI